MISLMMGPAAVKHSFSFSYTHRYFDQTKMMIFMITMIMRMMITRWRNVVDLNFMWVEGTKGVGGQRVSKMITLQRMMMWSSR